MSWSRTCSVCGARHDGDAMPETARVRSNVRRFRDETFVVWRCGSCRSIHARDEVDLDHYYAEYPFHRRTLDAVTRLFLRVNVRRLRRAGVRRGDAILDYGCGSGLFVRFLRSHGYTDVNGFDAFSATFSDRAPLERVYDGVIAQDVLEHVARPLELLAEFDRLVRPGGVVAIGTPNADALDLADPEAFIHMLHQPYHRTILARRALIDAGAALGWTVDRYYPTPYVNTFFPFLNVRTWVRYSRARDNTLDLAFEPFRIPAALLTPGGLFDALFGGGLCPETDIMVVFRKPAEPGPGGCSASLRSA